MIVVLDTSCISAFILSGNIGILIDILRGHETVITEQVYHELRLSKRQELKDFSHKKIKVMKAESTIADKYAIHIGEASVIMIAKKTDGLAIIDDKKARKAAQEEGVQFIGTAALIKIGIEKKAIDSKQAKKIVEDLTTIGKLYMNKEIVSWIVE